MRKYEKMQAGQILLIVVLVMTIALTVGLSIATRTITNIRTSTEQDNSQRAFSAAEAGLEKALQETTGSTGEFTNSNSSYETTVTAVSGTNFLFNNGSPIIKDASVDLWLSKYPDYSDPWEEGTVTIYWGNESGCSDPNTTAALDIILITGTKNSPTITQDTVDPCQARAGLNKFDNNNISGGTILEGKTFTFSREIEITDGLLMRIVPLYSSTRIGVSGCDTAGSCTVLPSQGKLITSVGTSDTTQRKIVGIQENPRLPIELFPYILFSP